MPKLLQPVTLPADPTLALQATTKQYVDNGLAGKASSNNSLTAAASQDVSVAGTIQGVTATLATTGVTAGTYTQVTVDSKGRVTAGSNPSGSYDTRQRAITRSIFGL